MTRRDFLRNFAGGMSAGGLSLLLGSGFVHAQSKIVIDAPTALERMQTGEMTLIDIRRPDEWKQTGIAEGAKAITMHDPKGPEGFLKNLLADLGGDKSATIGLICASGVRSTFMHRFLNANGFTNVVNVREGMLGRGPAPGWIKRGLPVREYDANG